MHTQTLLAMLSTLLGIMTLGLFVAWRFNQNIPGLGMWVLSYLFGFLASCSFLIAPLLLNQILQPFTSNLFLSLMAYCLFIGARAYMGLSPCPRWVLLLMIALLTLNVVYFTSVQFNPSLRVVAPSLVTGGFFILAAVTVAKGEARRFPARYAFALTCGFHGAFVIGRLWLVITGDKLSLTPFNLSGIPALVVMESMILLVLIAFGNMMLVNERVNAELRRVAEHDALTGVLNRRSLLSLFNKKILAADRHQSPLSVLLIDLDHFKKINDTWGHRVGDEVLCRFVEVALKSLRDGDILGRIGGEEFAVVLPDTTLEDARQIAERLRLQVLEQMKTTDENPVGLTVSIGVARLIHGESSEMLMHRADKAMYLSKSTGRNKVEAYVYN